MTYTIERWHGERGDTELELFFISSVKIVSKIYGDKFNYHRFDLRDFARKHRVTICRYKGKPIGFMMSILTSNIFDPDLIILRQVLLYGQPSTRAAYLLMQDFIDFGKNNANHIITMINTKTNIKRQSLEKLGFVKAEEFYRIEV